MGTPPLGDAILAPPATCWDLAPCGSEHEKDWQEAARALRATPEGEPGYLPNPFPGKDAADRASYSSD